VSLVALAGAAFSAFVATATAAGSDQSALTRNPRTPVSNRPTLKRWVAVG
jgi:hypothetical protein